MERVGAIVTYTYDLPPRRKAEKPAGAVTTVTSDTAASVIYDTETCLAIIPPPRITTYVYDPDGTWRDKPKG